MGDPKKSKNLRGGVLSKIIFIRVIESQLSPPLYHFSLFLFSTDGKSVDVLPNCMGLSIAGGAHSVLPHRFKPTIAHSFHFAPHAQIPNYATTLGEEMVGVPQLVNTSDICKKSALTVKVTIVL